MTLGQSETEAAKQNLTPDFFKSDADKAKENVEGGVRDLTGNAHGHDAARQGHSGLTNALKPSGEQSVTDQAQQQVDKAASHVQPNETKSTTQQARDYVTPGNDSSGATGILGQVGDKISNAATGVKDAVTGNNTHSDKV
ncbi:uncharacterized protein I303_105553 [Kwoniella dejecticola CBS 10117]|uniref:Chaperone/heat shock protein Hsp12 n=1 Tax=Kwoniella dejecticola CBS 10117 TaxID=1296121 RepID=A0A1A6A258_9TREE|nr:uncharacterized protein I303_05004 [Kwoniella dejecticola CBS 10117]OBR84147.1 hypothetical protein I303_05004 [Kwoniella dejecticola CBS 10117]